MKVTSQTCSSTCLMPTFWPRQYRAEVDFAPLCQADAAALRDGQGAGVEGVAKITQADLGA